MTDLYDLLGVPRDASTAAIKRAYRQMARTHHPDVGGSAEAFARIKRAHDVLIDPKARARYDATGLLEDEVVDPARAQMLDILSYALDRALFALAQETGPESPHAAQRLTALCVQALRERRQEWVQLRAGYQAALVQSQVISGQIKLPNNDGAIEQVLARRKETCERQLETLAKQIESLDQAIYLISGGVAQPAKQPAQTQPSTISQAPSDKSAPKPERFPYLDDGESISFGRMNKASS
jgi:curved DNA-binding protein CbpA